MNGPPPGPVSPFSSSPSVEACFSRNTTILVMMDLHFPFSPLTGARSGRTGFREAGGGVLLSMLNHSPVYNDAYKSSVSSFPLLSHLVCQPLFCAWVFSILTRQTVVDSLFLLRFVFSDIHVHLLKRRPPRLSPPCTVFLPVVPADDEVPGRMFFL